VGMGSCVNISNYNIVDRSESGVDCWAGGWSYTQQMIFKTRLLDSTILSWQKAENGAKSNPPRIPPLTYPASASACADIVTLCHAR
jgi:hypothetical protein